MKRAILYSIFTVLTFNVFSQGETCATAINLTLGQTISDGPSTGGGANFGSNTHSDWYTYTPSQTGNLTISSCENTNDTRLHVYSGNCSDLTSVANQDDDCGNNEDVTILVYANTTYYIEWTDSYSSESVTFNTSFEAVAITTGGETCNDAVAITNGTYYSDGPSSGNGAENVINTHSDWYKYTAASDGILDINSCNSNTDTRLRIYDGSCGNLSLINSYDDNCGANEEAKIELTSGQTLYIEWTDSYSTEQFTFDIEFTPTTEGETCSKAYDLVLGATTTDGPSSGNGAKDASSTHADWYKYTPNSTGQLTISSCGSSVDTDLNIYKGDCNSLELVADESDNCSLSEEISLLVSAGVTYYIEWGDNYSSSGFTFNSSFETVSITTAGENCSGAVAVSEGTYYTDGPSSGNGAESSSATHSDWYKYTAADTGRLTISSCGGNTDTRLYIYSGACGNLTLIDDFDDNCSTNASGSIDVSAGQTIYFEWGDNYDSEPFRFEVSQELVTAKTGGETCADAISITDGVYETDGPATGGGAESSASGTNADWYKYSVDNTGSVTISSCGATTDTRLYVYSGTCNSLTQLGSYDDDCDSQEEAELTGLTPGQEIYISWTDRWSSSAFEFEVQGGTISSIEGSENLSNDIYPNPTSGVFHVNTSDFISISIMDAQGQILISSNESTEFDLSSFPAGLYLVLIEKQGKTVTKKLIKK